eukprot:scaffold259175_cov31-Prasinocladus_malaysianus.AAC.1
MPQQEEHTRLLQEGTPPARFGHHRHRRLQAPSHPGTIGARHGLGSRSTLDCHLIESNHRSEEPISFT